MKKTEFNAAFRKYVSEHISPTPNERKLVTEIYEAMKNALGQENCLQIGSYARFTSITPLHDLDVLYLLGPHHGMPGDPVAALDALSKLLDSEFKNPTKFSTKISRQTHSMTMTFLKDSEEIFSVDIVPAYSDKKNEFGDDAYLVPELLSKSHSERRQLNEQVAKGSHKMTWIKSDPRGYVQAATSLNGTNDDFRRSVKFIKAWRTSCKKMDESFSLKSFHIEQIITKFFLANPNAEIFDAVFNFFYALPTNISKPQIRDRGDPARYIDQYIANLSDDEKSLVQQTRDFFLIKLEEFSGSDVGALIQAGKRARLRREETYLFDQKIPTLTEENLTIIATALPRKGGFRQMILDALGIIEVDRKIEFRIPNNAPIADIYKWKVKNDDNCREPRGEITDNRTKNDPESTAYNGKHYVECYAIRNKICVARARQYVSLRAD